VIDVIHRPIRLSMALSVAEYQALDWYAASLNIPTSSLARDLMREALLSRLRQGSFEGERYRTAMLEKQQVTLDQEEDE
jgi:hypothetical protein